MAKLTVIPHKESSFTDMWASLQKLQLVYAVYDAIDNYSLSSHNLNKTEKHQEAFVIYDSNPEEAYDSKIWQKEGLKCSYIYTDLALTTNKLVVLPIEPATALKRTFHHIHCPHGIFFNPSISLKDIGLKGKESLRKKECYSYFVKKESLPAIIGLLQTQYDINNRDFSQHLQWTKECLAQDKLYSAYFHTKIAKELKDNNSELLFNHIFALLMLGLTKKALRIINYCKQEDIAVDKFNVLQSIYLILKGETKKAKEILSIYIRSHPQCYYGLTEMGNALLLEGEINKAISYFNEALAVSESHISALMGLGVALRNKNYLTIDEHGLMQATSYFKKIIKYNGYSTPEAYHHLGTIMFALNEPNIAIECFLETLKRRESPVTRRNLSLAYHKIGFIEAGLKHYYWLKENFPTETYPLDKYYRASKTTAQKDISVNEAKNMLNHYANQASLKLKEWGINLKGDILDFKRMDEYISFHAPGGVFLDTCLFFDLSPNDLKKLCLCFAYHLAGVLVQQGHGKWVVLNNKYLMPIVSLINSPVNHPLNMTKIISARIHAGALADNLTSLEFLISHYPEYKTLVNNYQPIIKYIPASKSEISQFRERSAYSAQIMQQLGYELQYNIKDLAKIDNAIDNMFLEGGIIKESVYKDIFYRENIDIFLIGLGLHLGFVYLSYVQGIWIKHPSIYGISIQSSNLSPFYPIQKLYKRIFTANSSDIFTDLKALELPLICSKLSSQILSSTDNIKDSLYDLIKNEISQEVSQNYSKDTIARLVNIILQQKQN